MSLVIQISFEKDAELLAVTERLKDMPLKVSRKAYKSGKFKRVYLRTEQKQDKNETDKVPSA